MKPVVEASAVNPLRISTIVEKDGELHLTSLRGRKGDRVEGPLSDAQAEPPVPV